MHVNSTESANKKISSWEKRKNVNSMFGFRTQCQCQCQYLLKKFKITYTRLTAISIQYVPVFEICHKVTNSIQPSTHTVCWIFSIRCHYLWKKSELPIQKKRLTDWVSLHGVLIHLQENHSINSCNLFWANSIRCHCLLKALVDLQVSGVSDR